MILIQTPAARICSIPKSETYGANRFVMSGNTMMCYRGYGWITDIQLPPGQWKLLGRRDEVTEEQAKEIVEPLSVDTMIYAGQLETALESFHSLLSANNITNNDLLLIEIK